MAEAREPTKLGFVLFGTYSRLLLTLGTQQKRKKKVSTEVLAGLKNKREIVRVCVCVFVCGNDLAQGFLGHVFLTKTVSQKQHGRTKSSFRKRQLVR